jgi:hypothetical protein
MSPAAKFNALLASTTVLVMFFLIAYTVPHLQAAGVHYPIFLSIAALVTSAGIYRLFSLSLRWLMERSDLTRALVLGAHYMHGTWIGWFEGHTNERRYMVEHFIQDLDCLVITGRSFTEARKEHGYWESESCTIDARKGRLIFTYKFDRVTGSSSLVGIHSSLFERRSAYHAPKGISGLAHDLNDNLRIAVHSKKLSDKLVPWDEALEAAVQQFGKLPPAIVGRTAA